MGACMSADANNNTSVAPQGEPNGQQDAPDWDSYEIGEKEIRAVFDAVFYVYDKDSRGYLTTDQFGVLMQAFASDCRPPVSISSRELASFQDILDKDKNGIVEQTEFVSFFFDLAWITPEDRAAFVKLGPMFAKLAAIAEAETERLRRWVYVIHALFERHFSEQLMSSTGLPVVGPNELGALMKEGLSLDENPKQMYAPPMESELVRFVKFMDKDEDGLIDEQELICFCVQGLRQTPESNLAFASRSAMHAKLIGFLEAVNSFSGADAFSSNVQINTSQAQEASRDLDIDGYKETAARAPEETLEVKKQEIVAEDVVAPTPEPTVQPADPTASEPVTEPAPTEVVETVDIPVTEPAPTEVVETVDIGAAAEEEVVE